MTNVQQRGPEYWARIKPDGQAVTLFRFNRELGREEVMGHETGRFHRYTGDAYEEVLEGRMPVLTREEAADLFPIAKFDEPPIG